MLNIVVVAALVLSGLNWLVFVGVTVFVDLPALRRMSAHIAGLNVARAEIAPELDTLVKETGSLAGAFRRAGAAPTAAAMSLVCLVIATVAAGLVRM